jgi:predicted nucleic acid-binding Zn ribbon protein
MAKRNCLVCKNRFEKKQPLQFVCSYECAIIHSQNQKVKKEKKEWNNRKALLKKQTTKHSTLLQLLQKEINTLVRTIDYGQLCISSQRIPLKKNAGHFFSVGSHPSLRYNLLNIFLQSEHDNSHLSGNALNYRIQLKELFGSDLLDEVENLPLKYRVLKLQVDEIYSLIDKVRNLVKSHKSNYKDVVLSNDERIFLRKKYNLILGIYK